MTEETQQLFDAPWSVVEEPDCIWVQTQSSVTVVSEWEIYGKEAHEPVLKTMRRISLIPELYDALTEACELLCPGCTKEPCKVSYQDSPEGHCSVTGFVKLLREVRAGE